MKKHLSKRLLSLLLAAVMLVASAPIVAYGYDSADLADAISASSDVKYLFAYFTSNTQYGQQIRFAVSEDGLNYTALNYNSPVITHSDEYFEDVQAAGEVEANTQYKSKTYSSSAGYSRDPYVFKAGDYYYLICTDMDASTGGQHEEWNGDTCFVIFKSEDLMNWYQISVFSSTELGSIECTDNTTRDFSSTIRAWAPEVIYDESTGKYLLYWANFFSDWYASVFGVYLNDDFTDFDTESEVYEMYHSINTENGADTAAIDADIIEYSGTYYMFYKDEAEGEIGCVTSDTLTGPYSQDTYIDVTTGVSSVAVEGCQVYQIGNSDYYVLMMDEYNNGTFVFGITDSLDELDFEGMNTEDYSLSGFSPRHGSVIQISNEEYEALVNSGGTNVEIGTIEYPFSNEYTWDNPSSDYWYFGGIQDGSGYYFDVAIGAWTSGGFEDYVISDTGYGDTSGAYAETGDGYTAYMSNIFINDTSVREYLSSEDFTVSFDYTPYMDSLYDNDGDLLVDWSGGTSNGSLSGAAVIFAISTEKYDYIRITQDGTLTVCTSIDTDNDTAVYDSTNFEMPSTGVSANYIITYDGSVVTLYIDNEVAASLEVEGGIPGMEYGADTSSGYTSTGVFYAALGWTDVCADHYKPFGKYENLVFYNRAFTATEAQLGMATDLSTIESCMGTLEDLFGSGDLYYGMSDALAAYIEAQELLTVSEYGTVDVTADLNACLTELQTAINAMTLYHDSYQTSSLYTAYFSVEEVGSSILAASGNTYDASDKDSGGWQIDDSGDCELTYYTDYDTTWVFVTFESYTETALSVAGDSYILLYDGTNDVSAPIKYYFHTYENWRTDESWRSGLLSIYLNNEDLTQVTTTDDSILLTGINDRTYARYHWATWNTGTDENYFYIANYEVPSTEYYSSFYASTGLGFRTNDDDPFYYGFSTVLYSGTPEDTLTIVNPNVIFVDAFGNSTSFGNGGADNVKGTGSGASERYQTAISSSTATALDGTSAFADGYASTYYILDISDITEALNEVSASLASHKLSDFSAVMVDVFDVLEEVMAYSPYDTVQEYVGTDGYIASSQMQAVAEILEAEIDEYVEMVEQLEDVVVYNDYDGYDALKIARDNGEMNQAYTADSSVYTAESWEAFEAAYDKAVEEIDRLADANTHFRNELAENNTDKDMTIYEVVEDLYKAYYGLRTHADFTDVQEAEEDEAVQTGARTGLGEDIENQNYTYGSWYNFKTAYDAVVDFNDENPDDTVYAMYAEGEETTISVGSYGFTFTVTPESDTYSDIQQTADDLAEALLDAVDLLAAAAPDYSVYNAVTEEIKNQDVGAFAKGEDAALYTLLREQGTQEASVTYSVNGTVEVDTPVFDADSNVIEDEDGNKSINETAYVVDDDGNVWKNLSDQDTLDGYIAQMITYLNLVNDDTSEDNEERATYTVTYTIIDGETTTTETYTYYYGQIFTATVEEGSTVYKWVVESDDGVKTIPSSATYSAYITRDVTITAYLSQTDEDNEEQITLQILNQYGNLVQEFYVDADTEVTVDKYSLKIGDDEYTATDFSWLADTPFYTFDGWQVNGANYNNGTTFTVSDVDDGSGVVKLKIKMNVTSDGYTISLDGSPIDNYVYDQEVTITPTEPADETQTVYGIAIQIGSDYYVVSYGSEDYKFYVAGGVDLFTIYKNNDGSYTISGKTFTEESDADFVEKLDNQLPFSYSIGQLTDENNVFTTYSASTANVSVEVTEVGTIYTTSSDIGEDPEAFVLDTSGVSCVAATNQNTETMQYALRLSGCSGKTVYTRSYVKYSYTAADGKTVIQTVVYGNIVSTVDAD